MIMNGVWLFLKHILNRERKPWKLQSFFYFICDGENTAAHVCYVYDWGEGILEITFWRKGMKSKKFSATVRELFYFAAVRTYVVGRILKFWKFLFATLFLIFPIPLAYFSPKMIIKRD